MVPTFPFPLLVPQEFQYGTNSSDSVLQSSCNLPLLFFGAKTKEPTKDNEHYPLPNPNNQHLENNMDGTRSQQGMSSQENPRSKDRKITVGSCFKCSIQDFSRVVVNV